MRAGEADPARGGRSAPVSCRQGDGLGGRTSATRPKRPQFVRRFSRLTATGIPTFDAGEN
jgi:hypothetical protein